jgi:glyoxylase-like metal-dependent hydrolase (beta-lactamase superfamily II)
MLSGAAHTTSLDHGITAVDTEYVRPMHDASHLIVENGHAAFVDTGVNDSVPLLLDALRRQELAAADVDYVFLTHVHLDHAGGAGSLMRQLPVARCVVHPRGAPHMIDPAKLVRGTEAVYGRERTRRMYGTIEPIDADRIVTAEDGQWFEFRGRALQAIYTEGHARHHYVLYDPASRGVFTGDSFGVSYRELDTVNGEIVFPTTTPVQFDPGEAHKAIDRILACDPAQLYLTHYSRVTQVDKLAGQMHEGIDAYVAMALEHEHAPERTAAIEAGMLAWYEEKLQRHAYAAGSDAISSLLATDIALNTQGLEYWLDKGRQWKNSAPTG